MSTIELVARNQNSTVETGGLLLGFRKPEGLHVTKNTTPKAADVCKPFTFERKDPAHQFISTFHWIKSGFKCDWLGEWHSHPVAHPVPSATDVKTWQSQVKDRHSPMCYIIIGTQSNWVGSLKPTDLQPTRLSHLQYLEGAVLAQ